MCSLVLSSTTFCIPVAWASDWSFQRPNHSICPLDVSLHGGNTNEKASVGIGVTICEYKENTPSDPFNNHDGLIVKTVVDGNTRKIIDYSVSNADYDWHADLQEGQLIIGDDTIDHIQGLGEFRFYGGVGDAEYYLIGVSSNGVIFFNETSTSGYYSTTIPSKTNPDNFVAPFWRDLKPDGSSSVTYGIVTHLGIPYCLAISWNDIPDIHGHRQTFQLVIEPAPVFATPNSPTNYWQSRLWFQYNSITLDDQTTVGMEDQLGERGESYDYLNLYNGKAIEFSCHSHYAVIYSLAVEVVESDSLAWIDFHDDEDCYRGANVDLTPDQPAGDPSTYVMALGGTATLLLSVPGLPQTAVLGGFVLGMVLWGVDMVGLLGESAKKADIAIDDRKPDNVPNVATTYGYQPDYASSPVDAWFGIQFYWIFEDDDNTADHYLTIRTRLSYIEYDQYGYVEGSGSITASKTLGVYVPSGGVGGGWFCPTLFSWNGGTYVEEGLLNIHGDSDITINHTLEHLEPVGRLCLLSLRELDNYTSHIDQVRLLAMDAQDNWYECALAFAWHNNLGRVDALLAHNDEQRVDMAPGERTTLMFLLPKNANNVQHFVFELNGHNPKAMY